jgi:hypothetical protein
MQLRLKARPDVNAAANNQIYSKNCCAILGDFDLADVDSTKFQRPDRRATGRLHATLIHPLFESAIVNQAMDRGSNGDRTFRAPIRIVQISPLRYIPRLLKAGSKTCVQNAVVLGTPEH